MKKIYLFCTFGMSTSMLAKKMQDVANTHQLPLEVKAFTVGQIDHVVAQDKPDCILLGPQVKHEEQMIREKFKGTFIPIMLISAEDYGMMAADKVLRRAIDEIKK